MTMLLARAADVIELQRRLLRRKVTRLALLGHANPPAECLLLG
jgi:hypothetical protein